MRGAGTAAAAPAAALLAVALAAAGACATTGTPAADPSYDDTFDVRTLRERIAGARNEKGRGETLPFSVGQTYLTRARESITKGRNCDNALTYALEGGAHEGERDLLGWCVEADNLQQLRLPATLLVPDLLQLAIAIVRRPEGQSPRYLVLLATPSLHEYRVRSQLR